MKILLLALATITLLSSCSQNSDQSKSNNNDESVIIFEAKSGILTGAADFGDFNVGSTTTKIVTFSLKNNGTETLMGPATIDDPSQGFSIAYTNCPMSLLKTKSCTIKVSFDPRNLLAGEKSANLNFDSVFINLSASVNAPVVTPSVSYLISSTVVTSLDFGQLTDKQSILKSITIKNTGATSITDTVVVPSGYTLSYDMCSGKVINKGSSCNIKVSLSGAGKSGVIAGDVVYAGQTLSLSGEVISAATYSNVVILNSSGSVITNYNYGSLSGNNSSQLILNVKNTGTGTASLASATIPGTDFSIIYNQCSNISLSPNASCQVRVLFTAAGKLNNTYSSTLSFGDKQVSLEATVIPPPPSFTVSNIALSSDSKSFTVTGTGLLVVNSAKILETNQTEIDTLIIESKTATQLILKPSKNLTLPTGDVIMRIQ